MSDGGPTKTFPLRGIEDSPPYLHDGRLLTLDDTVEFFNLVLGLGSTQDEKVDLVRYMYTLKSAAEPVPISAGRGEATPQGRGLRV